MTLLSIRYIDYGINVYQYHSEDHQGTPHFFLAGVRPPSRGPKGRCGRDDCHPNGTGSPIDTFSFAGGNISQAPVVRRFLQTRSLDET